MDASLPVALNLAGKCFLRRGNIRTENPGRVKGSGRQSKIDCLKGLGSVANFATLVLKSSK